MTEGETRGERREQKRSSRRKMQVVGRSVKLLWQIIARRGQKPGGGQGKPPAPNAP